MAYLEFAPAGGGILADRPVFEPRTFSPAASELSDLEWTVVDLAQRDSLASVERPGAVARFVRWAVGIPSRNALSSPRLEALRRIAVLSWYRGFSVAPAEVRAFLAAGFTLDQYETLLARINARRVALPRRFQR
jgi:hypothetical protein